MSNCSICGRSGNMEFCKLCGKKALCSWCKCDCPLPETKEKHFIGYHKNFDTRKVMGSNLLDSEKAHCLKTFHFKDCTTEINETTCQECVLGWIDSCKESNLVLIEEMLNNTNYMAEASKRLMELKS